eukprot:764499-Hanusia_phi.AAC.8
MEHDIVLSQGIELKQDRQGGLFGTSSGQSSADCQLHSDSSQVLTSWKSRRCSVELELSISIRCNVNLLHLRSRR